MAGDALRGDAGEQRARAIGEPEGLALRLRPEPLVVLELRGTEGVAHL